MAERNLLSRIIDQLYGPINYAEPPKPYEPVQLELGFD